MGDGLSDDELEAHIVRALRGRAEEGMTIFELRNQVPADIDRIEGALAELNNRNIIECDTGGDRVIVRPTDTAYDDLGTADGSVMDRLRELLPW